MRMRLDYAATGIGEELALFLIREYKESDPQMEHLDAAAIMIIEKVADNIEGCGGPTWLGMLTILSNEHKSGYLLYPRDLVDPLAKAIKLEESNSSKKQVLSAVVRNAWKAWNSQRQN
jgi:hypothetical protein